ncbi:MAG: transcription termination/antitermination NusG family protein [Verrucomicrobiota bacterium]|nr:transcription termination/antitermination NusG family protein [Verrucomicrobiota bacterium]
MPAFVLAGAAQTVYFPGMGWNALYLKPRTEKKMAERARRLGMEFYLPLRRETKIYQRRKVTVDKPIFPGYFFVSFDAQGRVSLLKSNIIVRILGPANEAQLLHELAQIRKALEVDPTLSACLALKKGKRVLIRAGPFLGVEGLVSELKGPVKVLLNVEMIGRAVVVEADRDFLEVVDD